MCMTHEEAEAFHAALREPTGEPLQAYHDGTDPYSRYETDTPPAEFRRTEKLREAQDFIANA